VAESAQAARGVLELGSAALAAVADFVAATDTRLTNARTPTAHRSTHSTGGSDAITPSDIGAEASGAASTAIAAHLIAKSHLDLAGSAGQVQFNAAGTALGGAVGLTIDSSGNVNLAIFSGRLRIPTSVPGSPQIGDIYLSSSAQFFRDDNNVAQRLLMASGNLANVASSSQALFNLLTGNRLSVPYSTPTVVTLGSGSAGAISATSAVPPYSGLNVSGTSYAGVAHVYIPTIGPSWTGGAGKFLLSSLNEFYAAFTIVIPTLSTSGETFYVYLGGFNDSGSYSARNSIGAFINGSTLRAAATAGGTENLSSNSVTLAANTPYAVSIAYASNTLTVKVGDTTMTVGSGFPTGSVAFGVFNVKPAAIGGSALRTVGNAGGFVLLSLA
jgi:hypothetical protein